MAYPIGSISYKALKGKPLICVDALFKNCVDGCMFLRNLKAGDVSTSHKKAGNLKRLWTDQNFTVSLKNLRMIYCNSNEAVFSRMSKSLLCGFREHYNTQHAIQ